MRALSARRTQLEKHSLDFGPSRPVARGKWRRFLHCKVMGTYHIIVDCGYFNRNHHLNSPPTPSPRVFHQSFVLMAADRNAGRSILVFKHDEDKVR